jgi:hypothetical protein
MERADEHHNATAATTRLSDARPPLPGYAPPHPYGPPGSRALAPVGGFTRFCRHVPLPLVVAAVALFLLKQFSSGAEFRHDSVHKVIRFIDVVVFSAVAGAALVTAGIVFACTRRRLPPRTRRAAAAGAVLAVTAVVLAVALSEAVFRQGKSRAYAAVSAAALSSRPSLDGGLPKLH